MKLGKWRTLAVEGAMAAVVLAACGAIVARTISHGSAPPQVPHSATLAADDRTQATLQVVTGTPDLTIGVAALGAGTLLRVTTPAGSPAPRLTVAGANGAVVHLSAKDAAAVTVTLNEAVSWQLDLAGGTKRTVADLRGGQVTGIALTAGSDVVDLTLPRPRGGTHLQVLLAAGASQLLLSLPNGVPVRVDAAAGAGEISLDGDTHVGVARGSVFTTPGWTSGATGFDVDATAGAARITVRVWAG